MLHYCTTTSMFSQSPLNVSDIEVFSAKRAACVGRFSDWLALSCRKGVSSSASRERTEHTQMSVPETVRGVQDAQASGLIIQSGHFCGRTHRAPERLVCGRNLPRRSGGSAGEQVRGDVGRILALKRRHT